MSAFHLPFCYSNFPPCTTTFISDLLGPKWCVVAKMLQMCIAPTDRCVSNSLGLFGKKTTNTLIASVLAAVLSPGFPWLFTMENINKCYQKDNKTRDLDKNWRLCLLVLVILSNVLNTGIKKAMGKIFTGRNEKMWSKGLIGIFANAEPVVSAMILWCTKDLCSFTVIDTVRRTRGMPGVMLVYLLTCTFQNIVNIN